jgi:hypothetical protein
MKTFKTILISLLGLIIVAVIVGSVVISGIKRSALPQYKGELIASGLGTDVTVSTSQLVTYQDRKDCGLWTSYDALHKDVCQK